MKLGWEGGSNRGRRAGMWTETHFRMKKGRERERERER